MLDTIWVPVARVVHRVQPLDRLVAATVCYLLRKDFAVDAEPLKSLFHESSAEGLKWFLSYRKPLMTILMPVYNTDPEALKKSIESVTTQVYKKWELCIVDDASTRSHVRPTLEIYARKDPRIRLKFSDSNQGIAATINKAARMASGDYLGVLDHDDELDPLTLFEYVKTINEHPDADCIYCDEDKINEQGKYCDPTFKSDWNPDLALSFNYVMHLAVYRRSLFNAVGGVREEYEGSQDYDLLLRITEKTDKIYHIPKILYHWRMGPGSIAVGPDAKPHVFVSGLAALNNALSRRGIDGEAEDAPDAWKGVYRVERRIKDPLSGSILVMSSGNKNALSRLLSSLFSNILMKNHEILICVHSSMNLNKNEFSNQNRKGRIRWLEFDGVNSVPGAFNLAARKACCDVLLFLDETMELISSESFTCLLEQIQREEVGAAGGKVCYGNDLVEHAGVILGPFDLVGYAHRATSDVPGFAGMKNMIRNFSAVMGFGMMTRKTVFDSVCGFDEEYKNAYWDIDYCLRLREREYLVTYTPYARFRHHIPVKAINEMIVEPEAARFRSRWRRVIDRDPYYNPNFTRDLEDFSY